MATLSQTMTSTGSPGGVAARLEAIAAPMFGGDLPVRLRAWDGSEAGAVGAPVLSLRTPEAMRRIVAHPGELGLAQAYVTGELDIEGDLLDGFRRVWRSARRGQTRRIPTVTGVVDALKLARSLDAIGLPPVPPVSQARLRGRLHTKDRDRSAIAHHYDLSNDFYALILDPHMAYSSGYWTSDDAEYTVEDSQRDKLDLVCRKLGLVDGARMLDIGCGWGSLSLFAAEHYGARVLGVTISSEQKAFIETRIAERGLQDRVEVRLQDYREIPEGRFDAIGSIEMGEHVGDKNYATYVKAIHDRLRPGGRMLIQQMSRRANPGGGPFIEAFIAPDMSMRPVGRTVDLIESGGLEVRDVHALREHYVRTVDAWYRTFESNWDQVVAMVGEEIGRVWRLYLVGAALAFEEGRMGVDQILAVKPGAVGESGMPAVRIW